MDGLITHETPDVKLPTMIVAFAGWPDAAEAATQSDPVSSAQTAREKNS